MPQGFGNFSIPSTPNYSSVFSNSYQQNPYIKSLLNPETPDYFGSSASKDLDLEKLKSLIGKYKGIDFNTGKTVDLALEEFKKVTGTSNTAQPFDSFVPPPTVSTAEELAPTQLNVDQYLGFQKSLEDQLFESQRKQNLLGLGTATAYAGASLPFTEFIRNQELARQMQAFRMREESPTARAARSMSAQQQVGLASSAFADKLRAFSELKRATTEPHRRD